MIEAKQRCGFVALAGKPNVGKSSILNAILKCHIAPVTHKPQTTRKSIKGIVTEGNAQIIFVDTPGLHQAGKKSLNKLMINDAKMAIADVDIVLFVVDANFYNHDDEKVYAHFLQQKFLGENKKIFLILNKIDKLKDKSKLLIAMDHWQKIGVFEKIIPVSANSGKGLSELLQGISSSLPEASHIFDDEDITDSSEKEVAVELVREKMMAVLNKELPYSVAVTVDRFDESNRFDSNKPIVRIDISLHVERESQKQIVIGKNGKIIKHIGMMARKTLEQFLQCQVMLSTRVNVEKNWSSNTKLLNKLGYNI